MRLLLFISSAAAFVEKVFKQTQVSKLECQLFTLLNETTYIRQIVKLLFRMDFCYLRKYKLQKREISFQAIIGKGYLLSTWVTYLFPTKQQSTIIQPSFLFRKGLDYIFKTHFNEDHFFMYTYVRFIKNFISHFQFCATQYETQRRVENRQEVS